MPVVRSRKYRERLALGNRINSLGVEMTSCSFCERNRLSCFIAEGSGRCGECASHGQKCDVHGPSLGDWESLEREELRLQQETEETTAKLLRLQKQQKSFRKRAWEMLRRGLKTMDELDEAEEKERQEKENSERASREAATTVPTEPSDPFALDPSLVLDQAFWVEMGFGDGIPPASQGN